VRVHEFWDLTPFEVWVYIESHHRNLKDQAFLNSSLAWDMAYLNRVQRMPSFENWMNLQGGQKPKPPMTDEEKEQYLRDWDEKCAKIEALVNKVD